MMKCSGRGGAGKGAGVGLTRAAPNGVLVAEVKARAYLADGRAPLEILPSVGKQMPHR